jgi:hypothetical protein
MLHVLVPLCFIEMNCYIFLTLLMYSDHIKMLLWWAYLVANWLITSICQGNIHFSSSKSLSEVGSGRMVKSHTVNPPMHPKSRSGLASVFWCCNNLMYVRLQFSQFCWWRVRFSGIWHHSDSPKDVDSFSAILVHIYQPTWHHIVADLNLQSYTCWSTTSLI